MRMPKIHQNFENRKIIRLQKWSIWIKKSMKNQFRIIQKLLGNIFDNRDIIFHHSDHLKAKVEWGVPVKVIRMVI